MSNNIAFNVKRKDSISKMFLSTAISMIFIELAGVIATLIDGIVASKCIGVDTYSGISLVSPFTSIVLTFASFLFVEEMGSNVVRHGVLKYNESFDVRLFVSEDIICFSLTDLSNQFDPVDYYNLANDKETDRHMGIKLVNKMAKEVKYYNTFNSNNLLVYLEKESVGDKK